MRPGGRGRRQYQQKQKLARPETRATSVQTAGAAGIEELKMSRIQNTKKIWDYPKRKDCFMGRENRRYWLVNTKTGKKKRITEKQFHGDWAHVS